MATVSNTIKLQDKMTPILRNITNALNATLDVLESTDNASSQAFKGIRRDVQNAISAVNDLEQEVYGLKKSTDKARSGFSGWQAAITTANQALQLVRTTVQGIVNGIRTVSGFADSQTGLTSRLSLMTGSLEEAKQLQEEIFKSAQRSRASYSATADSIAQMGMMAAEAFTDVNGKLNTNELVAFTEAINKQLTISGVAGTAGADAALYQLTQAMSSGRLQGDELRSIMEQAPIIADTITDYVRGMDEAYANITKGDLRTLASEGIITAEVVKKAMLSSMKDIEGQFNQMPQTFGQAMTMLKNEAIMAAQPLVQQFSDFVQSDGFQGLYRFAVEQLPVVIMYIQELVDKISILSESSGAKQLASDFNMLLGVLGGILQFIVSIGTFFVNNWQWISPIIYGIVIALLLYKATLVGVAIAQGVKNAMDFIAEVQAYKNAKAILANSAAYDKQTVSTAAATVAQTSFNAALLASPITWILIIIIAVITALFLVVGVINKVTGSSISAIGIVTGALTSAVAFIWNLFLSLVDLILGIVNYWYNIFGSFVNFFGNVFNDPIGSIIQLFGQLADNVLGVLQSIARAMDKVFGSNMSDAVSGWRKNLSSNIEIATKKYGNGSYEKVMDELNLSSESLGMSRWAYSDAWDTGYNWGADVQSSIKEGLGAFDLNSLTTDMEQLARNSEEQTGLANGDNGAVQTQGEVTITDEDIKLLKDVAKAEWVNQYTTLRPELTVTFGDVHETADVNAILTEMENMVANAYASGLAY